MRKCKRCKGKGKVTILYWHDSSMDKIIICLKCKGTGKEEG